MTMLWYRSSRSRHRNRTYSHTAHTMKTRVLISKVCFITNYTYVRYVLISACFSQASKLFPPVWRSLTDDIRRCTSVVLDFLSPAFVLGGQEQAVRWSRPHAHNQPRTRNTNVYCWCVHSSKCFVYYARTRVELFLCVYMKLGRHFIRF